VITPEDVRRIAAIENPVLRNLEITHAYSLLAAAAAARSGAGANWCTFATWASRQAGATIRGEDALDLLTDRLGGGSLLHPLRSLGRRLLRRGLLDPGSWIGRAMARMHTRLDAVELASDAVARGIARCSPRTVSSPRIWLAGEPGFLDSLWPGDPPRRPAAPPRRLRALRHRALTAIGAVREPADRPA
jgi:hypothetical protein